MVALPENKLDALLARHALVEAELGRQLATDKYVALSREFAELGPVVDKVKAYRAVVGELAGVKVLIDDPSSDADMRAMASAEKSELEERLTALEHDIHIALLPKDAMDERNVIVEIRAGTGGDEAALFAGDLFRMYERYAAKPRAGSTPRRRPSRCCRRPRRSTWPSTPPISRLIPCAPKARAASTSTRPNRRSG